MSIFARVLVGVDGTDWGFEALRQALLLTSDDKPRLHAVTALDTAPTSHAGFQAEYFADALTKEAEATRLQTESIIAGRHGVSTHVVRGTPIDVLRRERKTLDADLVAIGGRRSSRFLGIMLGSVGTDLVHDASCSVLLASPPQDGEWQPRKVVVGFDGSDYAGSAIRCGGRLAEAFGGTVEVLTATGGKGVERDAAWAERVGSWDSGHPVAALVERSRTVDLVVVGSRGIHGIRAIGSVSERVAHQAHCSVLVVHEPRTHDRDAQQERS